MFKLIKINKSYGDKNVLVDVSLSLNNEVVALIGENGVGKTTLLKIMTGEISQDDGVIQTHDSIVGFLPQSQILASSVGDGFNKNSKQWQIDKALQEVGLDKPMDFETANLSGGQKTRLLIAKILASDLKPNILLFDEPTNNLDQDGLDWLEVYIRSFKGSVVIVSHDRAFINKTCSKVVELKYGKLTTYSGNYDAYKIQKDLELRRTQEVYEISAQERNRLEAILKSKSRQMSNIGNERFDKIRHEDKMSFNGSRNAAEKSTGKKIKALSSRINNFVMPEKPIVSKRYAVGIKGDIYEGKLVLKVEHLSASYDKNVIFRDISFEIRGSQRLRINGKNGSGKTTLLKIITGIKSADYGIVAAGSGVSVGYLSQDIDGIDLERTAFENLNEVNNDKMAIYEEARSLGLSADDLRKKSSELSRGQQAKLGFAKLLLGNHKLLILDEPTNHLDIATMESIEEPLKCYKGAIIVVSHDSYLINKLGVTQEIYL